MQAAIANIQPVISELEALMASNPSLADRLGEIKNRIQEMVQQIVGAHNAELNVVRSSAEIDDLTQLGNRRGWENTVARHEQDPNVGVVFLDLNGLKLVNDTMGHEAGDELIQKASDCIRASIRPTDYAARIGGDEFVILYTNYPANVGALQGSISRIRQHFDSAEIKVSVGGALRHEASTMQGVIILADNRMYENKRSMK